MVIRSIEDLSGLDHDNQVLGTFPEMQNSKIEFRGEGNIFFAEPGVRLVDCNINFFQNNSIVYLSKNRRDYILSISMYNNNVCYFGRDNYINSTLHIILSEQKHFFAGSNCLFSFGIWARTADPHLIYNSESFHRINPTKSIFLGDHVWIGQDAFLLKGSKVHSGSIVGARSLLSGKTVPSNTIWGGNPAKQIKKNILWDGACVHGWKENDTKNSQKFGKKNGADPKENQKFLYTRPANGENLFQQIDSFLDAHKSTEERMTYLHELSQNEDHNRFALEAPKDSTWKKIKNKLLK